MVHAEHMALCGLRSLREHVKNTDPGVSLLAILAQRLLVKVPRVIPMPCLVWKLVLKKTITIKSTLSVH